MSGPGPGMCFVPDILEVDPLAKRKLNQLSVDDLKAELQRRERELKKLQRRRQKVASQLADLDREIVSLGGTAGASGAGRGGVRRRPRNPHSLADMLVRVFPKDKPMKVADATAVVLKRGYKTTAENFGTIVNQTLIKDERFESVSRGFYRLKK